MTGIMKIPTVSKGSFLDRYLNYLSRIESSKIVMKFHLAFHSRVISEQESTELQ